MTAIAISMKQFVDFVGRTDVQPFRRHSNGSSWLLHDGRIASELYADGAWHWYITEVHNAHQDSGLASS